MAVSGRSNTTRRPPSTIVCTLATVAWNTIGFSSSFAISAPKRKARPISPKEERPGVTRLVSKLSNPSLRRFLCLCNLRRPEPQPCPARAAPHPGHQHLETPELVHDRRVTIHDLNRAGLTTAAGTEEVSPHVVGHSGLRHLLFLSPNPHVLRLRLLARYPSCLRSMGGVFLSAVAL